MVHNQPAMLLALCMVALLLSYAHAKVELSWAAKKQIKAAYNQIGRTSTKASPSFIEVRAGFQYVAPNCSALADVAAAFTQSHADPNSRSFLRVIVYLPCAAGSITNSQRQTVSWGQPNYNCTDPATGESIISGFFTTTRLAFLTITAMTRVGRSVGGCVLPNGFVTAVTPQIYGGAPVDGYGNELQYFVFGSNFSYTPQSTLRSPNLLFVTLTGLTITPQGRRPAIGAYNARSLFIRSSNVRGAFSRYQGAVVDAHDTTVTWFGARDYDTIADNAVVGFGPEITGVFPGAGGVFSIVQDLQLAPLTVFNVKFTNNSHSNFGAIYYVAKYHQLPTRVSFRNVQFTANSAGLVPEAAPEGGGGCVIGLTWREDGYINTDRGPVTNVSGRGFFISVTPWLWNWGTNAGPSGIFSSMYMCGVYSFQIPNPQLVGTTIPMPIDLVKRPTRIFQKGLTSAITSSVPIGLPLLNGTVGLEYAFRKA